MLIGAFVALYFVWGSTYLAISFAIESMPPFFMAGGRFLVPGICMYLVSRRAGSPQPNAGQWRTAATVGTCLLLIANGGITVAEQFVPSGLTALLVATMPMFLAVFGWLGRISPRPSALAWLGMAIGFFGVYVLVKPTSGAGGHSPHYALGIALCLSSSIVWSIGSLYSKKHTLNTSPLMAVGMQMICGGALLLVASGFCGEFSRLPGLVITPRALLAWIYLMSIGSVLAFTAYIWLLQVCDPALVGTYAFVNPVVAVVLGAVWNHEAINAHTALGAVLIVAAVAIVIVSNSGKGSNNNEQAELKEARVSV